MLMSGQICGQRWVLFIVIDSQLNQKITGFELENFKTVKIYFYFYWDSLIIFAVTVSIIHISYGDLGVQQGGIFFSDRTGQVTKGQV